MKIWLVEDDYLQAKNIKEALEASFGQDAVIVVRNESEFYQQVQSIVSATESVVVMDILLRWGDPAENAARPPESVVREGPYLAGFRCLDALAAEPGGTSVPVVVYTVFDRSDVESHIQQAKLKFQKIDFLLKVGNENGLIERIETILGSLN